MLFYGFSQMMAGALAGVPGVLTTMFRRSEDLRVPEMVRTELAAELAKNGKFRLVASGPADAEVRIRVREYGFFQAGFMRRQVKPILTVETQMIRRDGTLVWQNGTVIHGRMKGTPAHLPEELKETKTAAAALRVAAKLWAAKTADSLR